MEEIGGLQLQEELQKLSCINSEETLDSMLSTLWTTRKTGLPPSDISHFQSLLHLPSPSHLHPVLACLRWLVRKCAYRELNSEDLLKLFPPDLPLDLQTNLVLCLQKNRDRWKEELSKERVRTNCGDGAAAAALPHPSLSSSWCFQSLWPRQDDDSLHAHRTPTPILHDVPAPGFGLGLPTFFQCDSVVPSDTNLQNLPCLKSMTWTMENRGSSPADRVAIIFLKLHDYSKSPLGETEVKFQLTRDTLEAMLRSMTYISEQLSAVGTSSGQATKKQKQ
ncbi:hypothetical protein RJT34_21738 [Clitoria ternatea]|uniref:COMM domain-containing protein n=1 Tax=Clitoria ternatea TaxID=43366 RepID=A0AAN9IUJ6_CLITE